MPTSKQIIITRAPESYCQYPHFTFGEAKAQRSGVACPKSPSQSRVAQIRTEVKACREPNSGPLLIYDAPFQGLQLGESWWLQLLQSPPPWPHPLHPFGPHSEGVKLFEGNHVGHGPVSMASRLGQRQIDKGLQLATISS